MWLFQNLSLRITNIQMIWSGEILLNLYSNLLIFAVFHFRFDVRRLVLKHISFVSVLLFTVVNWFTIDLTLNMIVGNLPIRTVKNNRIILLLYYCADLVASFHREQRNSNYIVLYKRVKMLTRRKILFYRERDFPKTVIIMIYYAQYTGRRVGFCFYSSFLAIIHGRVPKRQTICYLSANAIAALHR